MSVNLAADFCRKHDILVEYWSCGYVVAEELETRYNIKLLGENAWTELEDELFYNER
jgi:hypothetical protein